MDDNSENSVAEESAQGKSVRLVWSDSDELTTRYANHLYISHAGDEFYIVFGELVPPNLAGKEIEEIPDLMHIIPVARIAIAPDVMLRMADIINVNIEAYVSKSGITEEIS